MSREKRGAKGGEKKRKKKNKTQLIPARAPPPPPPPRPLPPVPAPAPIIMDGNGRGARARGRPRLYGHRAGTENLRRVIERFADYGVACLTLYAFSTEDWSRPNGEGRG